MAVVGVKIAPDAPPALASWVAALEIGDKRPRVLVERDGAVLSGGSAMSRNRPRGSSSGKLFCS